MRPSTSDRSAHSAHRTRGIAAVQYIITIIFVGITGIVGFKSLSTRYRCKVMQATGLFNLGNSGAGATSCDDSDGDSGPVASNTPPPGDGTAGPQPSVTCVGTSCGIPGSRCFVAGTPVLTEAGLQPIERVAVGTRVWSRDDEGDATAWKPVVRTFARATNELIELTIGDADEHESIDVTPTHRVQAKGRGWIEAAQLIPGHDVLVDVHGRDVAVLAAESLAAETTVYNLEVEDFHTYYVGEHSFWAHNDCPFHHPAYPDPGCGYCMVQPPPPPAPTYRPPTSAYRPPQFRLGPPPMAPPSANPSYVPPHLAGNPPGSPYVIPPRRTDPAPYVGDAYRQSFGYHTTPDANVGSIMSGGLVSSYGGGGGGAAQTSGSSHFVNNSKGKVHYSNDPETADFYKDFYKGKGKRSSTLHMYLPPNHSVEEDPDSTDMSAYRTPHSIPPTNLRHPTLPPPVSYDHAAWASIRSRLPRQFRGLSDRELWEHLVYDERVDPNTLPPKPPRSGSYR